MATEIIRKHFIFHGRVQGVGFRATVAHRARDFDVVGYVRNLSDGTVEAEIQGTQQEIDQLRIAIHADFETNITDVTESEIATTDDIDFTVRW